MGFDHRLAGSTTSPLNRVTNELAVYLYIAIYITIYIYIYLNVLLVPRGLVEVFALFPGLRRDFREDWRRCFTLTTPPDEMVSVVPCRYGWDRENSSHE